MQTPTLKLRFILNDAVFLDYNGSQAIVTFGRAEENDLVLANPQVSRRQGRLVRRSNGWVLENLSSSVPIQQHGQPLTGPAIIHDGDRFQIGPLVLEILAGAPRTPTAPVGPPAKPVIPMPATLPQGVFLSGDPTEPPPKSTAAQAAATTILPTLEITYDIAPEVTQTDQYRLTEPHITIGRATDNTIQISVRTVSRHHASLRLDREGYVLFDENSTNGLRYKGAPIRELRLYDGAFVRIDDTEGNFVTLTYRDAQRPPPVRADAPTPALGQPISAVSQIAPDIEQIRIDAVDLAVQIDNNRMILNHISLTLYPQELVAVVGGSGTGKSTLVNALSGARPATHGMVYFNGVDYYQNLEDYRGRLGYVPQDDIVHTELSVERTLTYAARLRLPRNTSSEAIKQRVTEVLADVELSDHRATVVRRLSGGQRKRVSIAVELLSRPSLLFLDEPSTGLDPGIGKRLMSLLRRLADRGRTVVLITHATSNITVCDKLIFLARGGRLCYFGVPHDVRAFFAVQSFADIYATLEQDAASGPQWEQRFRESENYQQNVVKRLTEAGFGPQAVNGAQSALVAQPSAQPKAQPKQRSAPAKRISWLQQLSLLTRRYAELIWNDRYNLALALFPAPLIGLIISLVGGFAVFADGTPVLDAQRVVFLLALSAVFLGANNAAQEIVKELPIYIRERMAGVRIVPYVLSKCVVLAVLALVQSILLVVFALYSIGLPPYGAILPGLLELILGVWLTALAGVTMGLLISAWAPTTDIATSIVPVLLVLQIMLAGLIFPLDGCLTLGSGPSATVCLDVLSYPIVARWSTDSLGTTADLNRLFYQDFVSSPPGIRPLSLPQVLPSYVGSNYGSVATAATANQTTQELATARAVHLLGRWGILAGMSTLFLVLACLALWRKDRRWQVG